MKRKLALLLAVAMMLSLLPQVSLFANSDNSLSKTPSVVGERAAFVEQGLAGGQVREVEKNDDIKFVVDGTYLQIKPKNVVTTGTSIKIELENAKWLFSQAGKVHSKLNSGNVVGSSNPLNVDYENTVDPAYGTWNKTTQLYQRKASDGLPLYDLQVSGGDEKVATITFRRSIFLSGADAAIETGKDASGNPVLVQYIDSWGSAPRNNVLIPLVVRGTNDDAADIKVTLTGNGTISNGSWVFSTSNVTLTNTYVDDPKTARDEFPINKIVIKEQRIASIEPGTFRISAPSGFEFASNALTEIELWAENFGGGASEQIYGPGATTIRANVEWKTTRSENDYSAIDVTLYTATNAPSGAAAFLKSSTLSGTLYLKDSNDPTKLKLVADDGTAFGDINMKISNVKNTPISAQTFIGGIRKDWTIELKALGDIPTLVNGRYTGEDSIDAEDDYHLAATVSFKENVTNAWWSGKVTNFELPEGVKIRKAEITEAKKIEEKNDLVNSDRTSATYDEDYYMNSNKKDGYVTVKDNVLSISNVKVEKDEKATIEMKLWLSIESGYEGDVTLTVNGSGISDEVDPIVIAKAVSPVEVKTTITDVKVGYQYYPVADVELIETAAGMLEKDKQVWITATDRIYTDMYFTPGFKWEVTEGNIKIKNVDLGTGRKIVVSASGKITNNASADLGSGTIVFDVSTASSTASTIKFSNLQLKIDRTVPESSENHYSIYAWGPNIAPNSNVFDYSDIYSGGGSSRNYKNYVGNDQHTAIGIFAPYVRVVTSADGSNSVLNSVVKVTVGSGTAYVNGEAVTVDPAPFIDTATSRMMVPVRAVSYLLGIRPEQVIWSDGDRTVTVNMLNRTIQFTIGSDIFLINGAQVRMDTSAMIVDGRTFIPFRYLGDALGVQVGYDDATKTATYNADKDK